MIRLRPIILAGSLLVAAAAAAAERPALRGDVTVGRDALTLGDLVEHVPAPIAETPLFRAPGLGASGTIQTRRILDAAEALGVAGIETRGRMQVSVLRAARQVGPAEIEGALKAALAAQAGLESASTGVAFDGAAPGLTLSPEVGEAVAVSDLAFDRRTRRLAATIWVGPSPTERRAALRVTGTAVELVEVAVVVRSIDRGEAVRPADVSIEKRPREAVSPDAAYEGGSLDGRVARRALSPGNVVRSGDLVKPEIVARGDIVNVVYEVPGVALSLRGRASDGGALGDTISVVNPGTKKPLQGTIVGPGRVSVLPGQSLRVVAAATAQP